MDRKKLKIAFRVDASSAMGTGHVYRCLTLADVLKKNAEITFITRKHRGNMADLIREKGYVVSVLSAPYDTFKPSASDVPHARWLGLNWQSDAEETIGLLQGQKLDYLVIDHYALDARWISKLKPSVEKVVVIDDLADRKLECDFLLDQTYGQKEAAYSKWVNKNCHMLLGSKYALLRSEFSLLRKKAEKKWNNFSGIKQIFISMGGVDQENVTATILDGLAMLTADCTIKIDVVLGKNSPHIESIKKQVTHGSMDITVSAGVNDMAERMLKADLAIGAAGTTSWERCCLGLPTLMICLAENQHTIADNLHASGAAINLGQHNAINSAMICAEVQKLLDAPQQIQTMSQQSMRLVDGQGAQRVASTLLV